MGLDYRALVALLGVTVTLLIAYRQGYLKKQKLRVHVGFPLKGAKRAVWGFAFGIKNPSEYNICPLPIVIENVGNKSISNIAVQFTFPIANHATKINDLVQTGYHPEQGFNHKYNTVASTVFSEWKIELIRPGDTVVVFDSLLFASSEVFDLHATDSKQDLPVVCPALFHVSREHGQPIKGKVFVTAVVSESQESLDDTTTLWGVRFMKATGRKMKEIVAEGKVGVLTVPRKFWPKLSTWQLQSASPSKNGLGMFKAENQDFTQMATHGLAPVFVVREGKVAKKIDD